MFPVLTSTSLFNSGTDSFWSTVLGIAAFLAVIALSYVVLRWLSKRTLGGASKHMRVIERMAVGQGTYLMIVQVGQRIMALSATKDGLQFLCDVSPEDAGQTETILKSITAETDTNDDAQKGGSTFMQRFGHNMRIQMGMLPKDTPLARPASKSPPSAQIQFSDHKPVDVPTATVPGAFALALEKAQAPLLTEESEVGEDLTELLNLKTSNPIPEPDRATDSGNSAFADYNSAIERMKQLGRMEKPRLAVIAQEERVAPIAPRAAAALYKTSAVPPARVSPPRHEPPPEESAELQTELSAEPQIELQSEPQSEPRIAPRFMPVQETPQPPIDNDAADILEALNEHRRQRTVVPPAEEVPVQQKAPVKRKTEREMAALKLRADDDKVDELFDKISQRSSRYGRSKKE